MQLMEAINRGNITNINCNSLVVGHRELLLVKVKPIKVEDNSGKVKTINRLSELSPKNYRGIEVVNNARNLIINYI